MRILHYIPTLSRQDGGTSMYMLQLSELLGQRVDLHIVTHQTAEALPVRHARLHALPLTWRVCEVRRRYLQVLDEVKPDIVHINCCWRPYFALTAIWAKAAGYKVVLTPHGMLEPWIMQRHYLTRKVPMLLLMQRKALFAADLVHATAESEREHLQQLCRECWLLRKWHPRVTVIANGIDVDHITMRSDWTPTHRMLYLSRIHPKKGIDMLLQAFARLQQSQMSQSAPYVLQIAGEGDAAYIASLQALSRQLGIDSQVEWLGGIYDDRKWQLMRQADIFVLPTHSENFGIVVAEALASGTPVLTTQGTPWHELEDCQCGWWVPATEEGLYRGLTSFAATSAEEREAMGHNGRRLAVQSYSHGKMTDDFVQMYETLCRS